MSKQRTVEKSIKRNFRLNFQIGGAAFLNFKVLSPSTEVQKFLAEKWVNGRTGNQSNFNPSRYKEGGVRSFLRSYK